MIPDKPVWPSPQDPFRRIARARLLREAGRPGGSNLSAQELSLLRLFRQLPNDAQRAAAVDALGQYIASYARRSPAEDVNGGVVYRLME